MSTNHFSTEAPWWAHQYHHHQHMMEPSLKPSSRNQKKTSIFSNSHQIFPHPMNFNNSPSLTLNLNHEDYHNNDTSNEDLEDHIVKEETIGTKEGKTQESHYGEEKFIPIKEFLFEKPLTPSDVGKLNRLVIPKQHAEKYFPLNGSNNINNHNNINNNNDNNNNESGVEKGLLLSFEDELGKTWKFRYSYWNSSQSYVLTKGWSRFVKEKKLDAGDIVLFERHRRFDGDRFCIGWRRRGTPAAQPPSAVANGGSCGGGGGGGWNHVFYPHPSESSQHQHPYQPDCLHAGSNVQNHLGSQSIGQLKTLRLFGVNMECQTDDVESEPDTSDGSTMAIQGSAQYQFYHHQDQQYYYSKLNGYDHHNHMDMNISGDVKHMRYRLG